ncbi:PREDICTED: terminal uridylyltransferase 7 [Nanorana parkeri]|uniref:terminal uridylyltransferase 7 n=1 Tax=Nanorana parkeri TaxID=125878 RepID=UPI0008545FFB|nr:PREDICTED: terminal uridylyltransferase 7 [Nanorana parkeri]
MGDAAKRSKNGGLMDEEDFKRTPGKQSYLAHDSHGNNEGKKLDPQKSKPIPYSSSPRNGTLQNTLKNFSPGGRAGTNQKDGGKRWMTEEQRSSSDNWRERRSQAFNRARNDSTGEQADGCRWQEGGERRNRLGRTPIQKGAFPEDGSDQTGISVTRNKQKRDRRRYKSEQEEDDCLESPVIDESTLSEKELLGLKQAEERLKRDCIYRLKRRPQKYPTAIYTCDLCAALVDSISSAHKHIKEKRHKRNLKEKRQEELLMTLPPPTESQIQAIGVAISKVVQEHGMDEEDLVERLSTVSAMEALIHENLPGCSLRLYGSSCSRMGFKNSDLNIDIQFPASMNQPDVLLLVQDSLKHSDLFVDFDADFHARVPVVVCTEKRSGRLCKVSAGNENACLTTSLLTTLGLLESRLMPLVVAFRYWAKLCGIDRPEEGGLPPYVLALMVVFFFQQRNESVLPVYLGSWIEGFSVSKLGQFSLRELDKEYVTWIQTAGDGESLQNEQRQLNGKVPVIFPAEKQCSASVGQLWVDLLKFYALEFNMGDFVINVRVKEKISRELKDWPKKRIAVEDPYSVKRNVARSLNSQLVFEFMLHCLKATYKYFAMPQSKSQKSKKKPTNATSVDLEGIRIKSESEKQSNLILDASQKLENLSIDDNENKVNNSAIGMSHCEGLNIVVKKKLVFNTLADLAIEDDCITEEALANPEDAIQSCKDLEIAHEGSNDDQPVAKEKQQNDYILISHGFDDDSESGDAHVAGNEETDSLSDFEGGLGAEGHDFPLDGADMYAGKADLDEESTEDDELEEMANNSDDEDEEDEENGLLLNRREHLDSLTADEELENTYPGSADDLLSEDDQLTEHVSSGILKADVEFPGTLKDEDPKQLITATDNCGIEDATLFYEFSKPTFTKGKLPTVVCNLCKKEGHLKKDCPEDFKKIELEPLPPLTSKFCQILDQVCMQCYTDFSPSALEGKAREHIRQDLEDFVRRDFPGARLNLFGSSKNGFGFIESDLDICLTFDGLETAETLDSIRTIEELARHLRKHQGLRNILPITTAKVPIVKFFHVRSGLEGDISLYNTLALHNTRLLASYAAIDPRVKYLCYIMKVFTKVCDIGDASRGSLSSYAYTLMVLYFLQQRDPPVIPVLQEIYIDAHRPEILVDGWNVYFFDKLDELSKHWPDYGKNKESPGELWLGLLRFYTEDFDFKEHVISIRRKSLLTTFKKQWTSKYIVIEDPFDLNHNLGAGLSRKMTNFIMKGFINGRRVFGTAVKSFPKEYRSKMEYFFDPDVLTEGELAPNDRCCRICGKIGHFMKDCPMRRKARRRNHENASNQRYPDKRPQRKIEDKEMNMQGGGVSVDGRELHTTPRKAQQGPWSNNEPCKDRTPRSGSEKWKRPEDRELREKRCFICGREGHIKKECPQYKGPAGSPKSDTVYGSPSGASPQKPQARFIPVVPSPDDRKKQKMSFSPQSGSLSNKYMSQGKASQRRTQQES